MPLLANAYFLLNQAYKAWRIEDDHNTERPKIASLLCLAIATFPPFRPIVATDVRTTAEARANEIFAVACACATLGVTFDLDDQHKVDFWLRLLDILSEYRSETLEPYLVDVNLEARRPLGSYELALHERDKSAINQLVTIFEVLSGKITVERVDLT